MTSTYFLLQMGLIDFSSSVIEAIKLTEFTDLDSFSNAVDQRVVHLREATYTHLALKMARTDGFIGHRADIPMTVVMVTDGDPTFFYEQNAYDEADLLRAAGIDLIIVAIGQTVTMEKMVKMAGGDASKVLSAQSLPQVFGVLEELANSVCGGEVFQHLQPSFSVSHVDR